MIIQTFDQIFAVNNLTLTLDSIVFCLMEKNTIKCVITQKNMAGNSTGGNFPIERIPF